MGKDHSTKLIRLINTYGWIDSMCCYFILLLSRSRFFRIRNQECFVQATFVFFCDFYIFFSPSLFHKIEMCSDVFDGLNPHGKRSCKFFFFFLRILSNALFCFFNKTFPAHLSMFGSKPCIIAFSYANNSFFGAEALRITFVKTKDVQSRKSR